MLIMDCKRVRNMGDRLAGVADKTDYPKSVFPLSKTGDREEPWPSCSPVLFIEQ